MGRKEENIRNILTKYVHGSSKWMASSKASVNLGMRTNNGLRGRQIKEKRKVERETDGRSTADWITSVCSSMHGRSIDDHHDWLIINSRTEANSEWRNT